MRDACEEVQYILFDMDGVVVDSMPSHADIWKEIFREYGLTLNDEDIFRREGMAGIDSIAEIFSEKNCQVPTAEELMSLQERKITIFKNYNVKIFEGIHGILSCLKDNGARIGLVTGSLRRSVEHMLDDEMLSFFDAIVTVDDVDRGKPFPDPYMRALELLDSDKKDSLVIENAPMGIKAAKAAELYCVAIETTLPESYLEEADCVVKDHYELNTFLKSVCATCGVSA